MDAERPLRPWGSIDAVRRVEGLTFFVATYPAGLRIGPHTHEGELFLTLVLDGGFVVAARSGELGADESTALLHAPEERRSTRFAPRPTTLLNVRLDARWWEGGEGALEPPQRSATVRGPLPAALSQRLLGEVGGEAPPVIAECLVLELVQMLRRVRARSPEPRWLLRARELLHDLYRQPLAVTPIAQELGIHPVHLHRAFRRRFGLTLGEYVRRLRVEEACRALRATRQPLADLALDLGFADQAHFSRTFRSLVGVTPRRYRAGAR